MPQATAGGLIRPCPSCGVKNRVPAEHLAATGRCGSCKADLPPVDEPVDADAAFFDQVAARTPVPVLVDFWAGWCAPCRMVAPEVARTARAMAGRAVVLKVDTEANPELASRFGVRGIPNFMVVSRGKVVVQQSGAVPGEQMQAWLRQAGA